MNDEHANSSVVRSLQRKTRRYRKKHSSVIEESREIYPNPHWDLRKERCRRRVVGSKDPRRYNTGNSVKTLLYRYNGGTTEYREIFRQLSEATIGTAGNQPIHHCYNIGLKVKR